MVLFLGAPVANPYVSKSCYCTGIDIIFYGSITRGDINGTHRGSKKEGDNVLFTCYRLHMTAQGNQLGHHITQRGVFRSREDGPAPSLDRGNTHQQLPSEHCQ